MKKALDLFSGKRMALAAFKDWDVTHIDIIDGNPIEDFIPDHVYDFMWASPPCNEYSLANTRNYYRIPDRTLWLEALRVIDAGKKARTPWVIENVCGAQRWWGRPKEHCGPWYFWGWYPKTRFPKLAPKKVMSPWKTSEERSVIPYAISEAFYKAITARA